MTKNKVFIRFDLVVFVICVCLFSSPNRVFAQTTVSTDSLKSEIREFTAREIAAHFANIKALDPPPERVFNGLTVGDFSWGSFARALAAQADIGGNRFIAGKDTARAIAEIGLIEARKCGKSFAQLYSILALRHYGKDLSQNAVWLSLSEPEKKEWLNFSIPHVLR